MRRVDVAVAAGVVALAASLSGCSALSPYDQAVIADTPVLYLSGGADLIGAHTVIGHGGITAGTLPNGQAVDVFDGATGYREIVDADDLSVTATGALTVEAWLRPDVLTFPHEQGSGYVHWLGKGEPGQHEYVARMYGLDSTDTPPRPNRVSGYAFNLSGGLGAGSYFQDPLTADTWVHYVLTINTASTAGCATGVTRVYRDGVLRDTDCLSGYDITPGNGTAPLRVGTRDFWSWFQGGIGAVAVYDRELPAERIAAHTAAMTGGSIS